jgi:hypothetical protein
VMRGGGLVIEKETESEHSILGNGLFLKFALINRNYFIYFIKRSSAIPWHGTLTARRA